MCYVQRRELCPPETVQFLLKLLELPLSVSHPVSLVVSPLVFPLVGRGGVLPAIPVVSPLVVVGVVVDSLLAVLGWPGSPKIPVMCPLWGVVPMVLPSLSAIILLIFLFALIVRVLPPLAFLLWRIRGFILGVFSYG